jgi:hypothetical protein
MADVVLGYDVLLKRDVAIKIFRSGSGTPDDEERFDREARVLASLSHPNLVTVFDAGIDTNSAHPGGPYLVMEYVAGPTVADVIADGPVDSAQVALLGAQVAAALDCVHRHGIVHRDVKPGNILLTSAFGGDEPADAALGSSPGTWNAKLTDFGIARVVDSAPLTVQGLTVGTATYLSPEQARGQPAGPASDIYSLALVLLELATGQRAFAGVAPEVAFARLDRRPEIPRTIGPGLVALLRGNDDGRPPTATVGARRVRSAAGRICLGCEVEPTIPGDQSRLGGQRDRCRNSCTGHSRRCRKRRAIHRRTPATLNRTHPRRSVCSRGGRCGVGWANDASGPGFGARPAAVWNCAAALRWTIACCSGGDAACAADPPGQAGLAWTRQAQAVALTRGPNRSRTLTT